MPINKLALIRYKTIDNCLQNRFRKWTLDDLVDACSRTLEEFEGITQGVSKRTVQLDIQTMRSEKLGYNAPIVVIDKKYYCYEDKAYSITNIPLTSQDLGTLTEVVEVLRQFKGFSYFDELTGMVNKLEDKIQSQKNKGRSYIHFERNDLLKGLEHIEPVHKAILRSKVLEVTYQSFKAREASGIIFHPYLLKEYRNRWFVIGWAKKKALLTLALDRADSSFAAAAEDRRRWCDLQHPRYMEFRARARNPRLRGADQSAFAPQTAEQDPSPGETDGGDVCGAGQCRGNKMTFRK
jgi:predicted DNA-binding transcriptional regulator YafY